MTPVADGRADDTAALRRWVVEAATGRATQLPRGIIRTTDTVVIPPGFGGRFQGSGSSVIHLGTAPRGGPLLSPGYAWGGTVISYDGPPGRPVLVYSGQGAVFDGFDIWGNGKASVGFLLKQTSGIGSGHCRFGSIGVATCDVGIQCGERELDGNCGDVRVELLTAYDCGTAFRVVNNQGLNYSFGHVDAVRTKTVFDFERGGCFDAQFVHGNVIDTVLRIGKCGSGNALYRIGMLSLDAQQMDDGRTPKGLELGQLPRLVDQTFWGPARVIIESAKLDVTTPARKDALVRLYGDARCTIRNAAYLRGQLYDVTGGDVPRIPVRLTLDGVTFAEGEKARGVRRSGPLELICTSPATR